MLSGSGIRRFERHLSHKLPKPSAQLAPENLRSPIILDDTLVVWDGEVRAHAGERDPAS